MTGIGHMVRKQRLLLWLIYKRRMYSTGCGPKIMFLGGVHPRHEFLEDQFW